MFLHSSLILQFSSAPSNQVGNLPKADSKPNCLTLQNVNNLYRVLKGFVVAADSLEKCIHSSLWLHVLLADIVNDEQDKGVLLLF